MAAFYLENTPVSRDFGRSGYNGEDDSSKGNKGRSGYNKSDNTTVKRPSLSHFKGDDDKDKDSGRSGYN